MPTGTDEEKEAHTGRTASQRSQSTRVAELRFQMGLLMPQSYTAKRLPPQNGKGVSMKAFSRFLNCLVQIPISNLKEGTNNKEHTQRG